MRVFYLKLRANIELDGDLKLAAREINALFNRNFFLNRNNLIEAQHYLDLSNEIFTSHIRDGETIGYLAFNPKVEILDLLKQLSFIQEVWFEKKDVESEIETADFSARTDNFICAVPFLALSEWLTYSKTDAPNLQFVKTILDVLALKAENPIISKLIMRRNTSAPHVHGLHAYKAKFFPRFIRSLIVSETPLENRHRQIILDPFAGSGTAIVEAALLGFRSVGIDIDKLSCLISESKIKLLENSFESIQKSAIDIYRNGTETAKTYRLPSWMSRKFERKNNLEEKNLYEKQISRWIKKFDEADEHKIIFQTAVSDALTRKFNVRMMGTGAGRFALEIQKASIDKLIEQNIKYTLKCAVIFQLLRKLYRIELKTPLFINGTATDISLAQESIDFVITSPPYLPASSGRENYLIGKSISLTALNLMDETEIGRAEKQSVGSMKNKRGERNGLPKKIYELYDWLFKDELRNIKAQPTLSYYQDLKKSLEEVHRILKPNGKAIYIIGKETVFYSYKTREILYRVECDEIFKRIAESVGFEIAETIDIELDKKNRNARPRSLDKYFETAVILKKSRRPDESF